MEVGRNDPCPCGSGKKYKKCCGAKLHSGNDSNEQKVLYIQVEGSTPENLLKLAASGFDKGAKEIHVGWDHCGLCGKEIEVEEVKGMRMVNPSETDRTLVLHLCDDCWPKFESLGENIGKG